MSTEDWIKVVKEFDQALEAARSSWGRVLEDDDDEMDSGSEEKRNILNPTSLGHQGKREQCTAVTTADAFSRLRGCTQLLLRSSQALHQIAPQFPGTAYAKEADTAAAIATRLEELQDALIKGVPLHQQDVLYELSMYYAFWTTHPFL